MRPVRGHQKHPGLQHPHSGQHRWWKREGGKSIQKVIWTPNSELTIIVILKMDITVLKLTCLLPLVDIDIYIMINVLNASYFHIMGFINETFGSFTTSWFRAQVKMSVTFTWTVSISVLHFPHTVKCKVSFFSSKTQIGKLILAVAVFLKKLTFLVNKS